MDDKLATASQRVYEAEMLLQKHNTEIAEISSLLSQKAEAKELTAFVQHHRVEELSDVLSSKEDKNTFEAFKMISEDKINVNKLSRLIYFDFLNRLLIEI